MQEHSNNLNERQKEAVLHKNGPLLIVAGAGAGKTKTIVHRIANLINSGVEPKNILAVTFTNKAAKEMSDRVRILLPMNTGFSNIPFISTFHSLGVRILKENASTIGRSRYFSILDDDGTISFLKRSAKDLGFDPKEINIKSIRNAISRGKNKMQSIENYQNESKSGYFKDMVAKIWRKYEDMLTENESYDFDDLIQKSVLLLKNKKEILDRYQDLWKYIHIDEYQDTNTSQYELSRLLAEKHGNICVVGDSDQAIYSWRYADFKNILDFENNFPGAKTVLLEENYRSTKTILDLANRVIQRNKLRKEKNLFTRNEDGEKITLFEAIDEYDEAGFVVKKCKEIISKGNVKPEEIAVLYRANFQSRILEENFLKTGTPYQILGTRFYERKEVKDIIAFIKFSLNPKDKESFGRIINVPPRGIGKTSLEKILGLNYQLSITNYELLKNEASLPEKMREKVIDFARKMEKIRETILKEKLPQAIKFIVKETGMDVMLKEDGKEEGIDRLGNILELANIATKYDNLPIEEALDKFLTDTSLMSDQDAIMDKKKKEGVRLMTVHASKGLEFKNVFIVGLEDNLFPHRSFGDDDSSDPEEERRLFYVAVTRAKEKLFLSYSSSRMIFGTRQMNLPSEFLPDLDDSIVSVEKNEKCFDSRNYGGNIYKNTSEDDIIWDCLK